MRKSRAEAAETRRAIVDVAAMEFRANGIQGTGLADVMAAAGLSHGGFYRHFGSKDQLIAEACEAASKALIGSLEEAAAGGDREAGFKSIVDAYLSIEHRDAPARGCLFASVGSELARADDVTRKAASAGFDELVDMLAKRLSGADKNGVRSRAEFMVAAMIGALMMSRIIPDPEASASLLDNVRQHIETF